MCAEKTEGKNKETSNSCCNGMAEMVKNFINRTKEATSCCSQLKDKCGSDVYRETDCMTMFKQKQNESDSQVVDIKKNKDSSCCF